jgi:DNA polymerase III sliding clamp (beta) subunit (PCNA family)
VSPAHRRARLWRPAPLLARAGGHFAANPDLGEAVEQLPGEYPGPSLLGLNPDYLGHFLGAVEAPQVRLELKDAESQCVGYPVAGEDLRYLCVIMPMHV